MKENEFLIPRIQFPLHNHHIAIYLTEVGIISCKVYDDNKKEPYIQQRETMLDNI